MSVQNMQLNENKPHSILERGLNYLGIAVDPEKLEVATDLALTAMTLPVNTNTVFPLKYYSTSTFTTVVLNELDKENFIEKGAEVSAFDDKLLYHALLYVVGKSIGLWFWQNTDLPMTLLSSPKVMRFMCNQPWFQALKSDLVSKIGPNVLKDVAIRIAKGKAKKYIEKKFIEPLRTIFNQTQEETLDHFTESLKECMEERIEIAQGFFEEGEELAGSLLKNGMSLSLLESSIDFHKSVVKQSIELSSLPSFRLTPKVHKSFLPLHQKVLAAWGVFGSLRPELATFALINPASTVIEVFFRIIGAVIGAITGSPFTSLALTECAIRLIPERVQKLPPVQKLTLEMQQFLMQFSQEIQKPRQELRKNLLEHGVRVIDVRNLEKFLGQFLVATSYACLNITGNPLVSALSASSFIQYVGAIGENFGIVKASTFESEQGYLRTLPLQVITGIGLTILEIGNGEVARPMLAFMAAIGTMPYVSDKLVSSTFYNEYILQPIGNTLVPYYPRITQTARVYEIVSKITSYIPKNSLLAPIKYLKTVVYGAQCVLVTGAAMKVLQHPYTAKVKQWGMQAVTKGGEVYSRSVVSSTVGYYLGGPVGALSNLTGLPKDRLTIPVGITALGTWYLTNNSHVTTIATIAVNDCLRSPVTYEIAEKVKKVAIQEIAEIVDKPFDGITLLSNAVGVSVSILTQDPVSGFLASAVTNEALRLPIVEEVVEAGQSALVAARQKCTIL
jgi:hypothetical protein